MNLFIENLFEFVVSGLLLLILFFQSYVSQKGKNFATKEDISEITEKIEEVKHDYAKQLESTRAGLSSLINIHSFRYEREFDILLKLSDKLVECKEAVMVLRPIIDYLPLDKSKDEVDQERLNDFADKFTDLRMFMEKRRAFYPRMIYDQLQSIVDLALKEGLSSKYKHEAGNTYSKEYWKEARKNQNDISTSILKALESIRSRVNEWDDLQENV